MSNEVRLQEASVERVTLTFARSPCETVWNDVRTMSFSQLAMCVFAPQVGDKAGPCYTPARFVGTTRKMDQSAAIDVAVLDSDCGHSLVEIVKSIKLKGYRAIVHSTHGHMATETLIAAVPFEKWRAENPSMGVVDYLLHKKGYLPSVLANAKIVGEREKDGARNLIVLHQPCPKFRVIVLLKKPWIAASYSSQSVANLAWRERIMALAEILGLRHDQSCMDTSRLFFLPRIRAAEAPFEFEEIRGQSCDIFELPIATKTAAITSSSSGLVRKRGDASEFVTADGEIIDLKRWVAEYGTRFEVAKAIDAGRPEIFTRRVNGVKRHILCPNAGEHITGGAEETGTFVVNASELPYAGLPSVRSGFVVHCSHNGCSDLDRLDHLHAMLADGTLTPDDLWDCRFLTPAAGEEKTDLLPLFCARDLDGRDVPPRRQLVKGLIPARAVTLLSGDGGTGKSLVALQLGVAVQLSTRWLGHEVSETGPVIFFTAEDDRDEIHRRMNDILRRESASFKDLDGLHVAPLAGEDALLGEATREGIIKPTGLFHALESHTQRLKPKLVVIDTLADTFGGDEIKRAQARQFIGLLRGLAMRYDTAVLLLAHPSLSGMNSGSGMSGSTGWNNSVRSRLYFERVKERDRYETDPDARVLKTMKSNYGPAGTETQCYWREGVFVTDAARGEAGLAAERSERAKVVFRELLRKYSSDGRGVSSSPSQTYAPAVFAKDRRSCGIGKAALVDAMNSLFDSGEIRNELTGPPSKQRKHIVLVEQ